MNIMKAFPSKYLKSADLNGETVLTMTNVAMEELEGQHGTEEKPVVSFAETEQSLVLNKTNAVTIMELYGPETRTWDGKQIVLYPTRVQFGPKMVDAIRIKLEVPGSNGQKGGAQEEIPF